MIPCSPSEPKDARAATDTVGARVEAEGLQVGEEQGRAGTQCSYQDQSGGGSSAEHASIFERPMKAVEADQEPSIIGGARSSQPLLPPNPAWACILSCTSSRRCAQIAIASPGLLGDVKGDELIHRASPFRGGHRLVDSLSKLVQNRGGARDRLLNALEQCGRLGDDRSQSVISSAAS